MTMESVHARAAWMMMGLVMTGMVDMELMARPETDGNLMTGKNMALDQ